MLEKVRRYYPRPDLVVVLKAPAPILLARKRELTPEEIHRQNAILEQLPLDSSHTLIVDATRPPEESAREIWDEMLTLEGEAATELLMPYR